MSAFILIREFKRCRAYGVVPDHPGQINGLEANELLFIRSKKHLIKHYTNV